MWFRRSNQSIPSLVVTSKLSSVLGFEAFLAVVERIHNNFLKTLMPGSPTLMDKARGNEDDVCMAISSVFEELGYRHFKTLLP
ncbi:hypothetical protein CB1_001108078 [Camelus ferus]|nr:hypothetical protein CB1_001108078 [Camelus ferus]